MNRLILFNIKREAALVQDTKKVLENIFELEQIFCPTYVQSIEIRIGNAHHKFEDVEEDELLLVYLDRVVIQLAVHQRLEEWPRVIVLTLLSVLAGSHHKVLIRLHMVKHLVERSDSNPQKVTRSRHIPDDLLLHDI
jgi:hypothetical protein